ncbi:MAG: hypothetical protein CMM07_03845 [Rhodopirellula sp.]|nr:hypothetical protein [Rhodopirellula sp.]
MKQDWFHKKLTLTSRIFAKTRFSQKPNPSKTGKSRLKCLAEHPSSGGECLSGNAKLNRPCGSPPSLTLKKRQVTKTANNWWQPAGGPTALIYQSESGFNAQKTTSKSLSLVPLNWYH